MRFIEPVTLRGRVATLEPLARRARAGARAGGAPTATCGGSGTRRSRRRTGWTTTWRPRSTCASGRTRCRSSSATTRAATSSAARASSTSTRRTAGVEIGHTWYAKRVQRTPLNTECKLLLLTHAFEALALHRRRVPHALVQPRVARGDRAAGREAGRRAAQPPADAGRREARHRRVLDHRQRMAGGARSTCASSSTGRAEGGDGHGRPCGDARSWRCCWRELPGIGGAATTGRRSTARKKLTSSVEQRICTDPKLAALDRQLADVYAAAIRQGRPTPTRSRSRTAQRGWIKGRNDCWKSTDVPACVENAYRAAHRRAAGALPADRSRSAAARYQCPGTAAAGSDRGVLRHRSADRDGRLRGRDAAHVRRRRRAAARAIPAAIGSSGNTRAWRWSGGAPRRAR